MFSRTIFLFLDFGKFFSRVIYPRFKREKLFKPANLRKNSEFKIVNGKQKATKQGLDHRFVALTRFICRIFVFFGGFRYCSLPFKKVRSTLFVP